MTIAWQLAFLVIGSDPVRFRPLMIPSMVEKFYTVLSMAALFVQGRIALTDMIVISPDLALGILFVIAFAKTSAAADDWLRANVAMKILAVCGSLQANSGNLALLQAAAASAPSSVEFVLCDGLRDLPHFNPDIEASGTPESVRRWRQALADSRAVLIASPSTASACPAR